MDKLICPFCNGNLATGSPIEGRPAFRCAKCNVRITITNPSYLGWRLRRDYWNAESGTTACSAAGCCVESENSLRSAAGNPDGPHWTEGFEGFLKEQLELAEMAHRRNPCGPTSVRPRTLKMVMDAFQWHKGQGAALTSDEPPGSAAGNPDGSDSLEAFEDWVCEHLIEEWRDVPANTVITGIVGEKWHWIVMAIREYRSRGAA